MASLKVFNPKKCHNCQKVLLKRAHILLCPKCFRFVDNVVHTELASLYNPDWEFTDAVLPSFKLAMDRAIAQAAMGTIQTKPVSIDFRDSGGSKIERGGRVRLAHKNRFFNGRVTYLDINTGKISVRIIADPPEIINDVSPSDCEVIHDQHSEEHPDS